MRVLFVTPIISWPLTFGGDIRRWNVLQGLLQTGTVDALVFRRGEALAGPEAFQGCRQLFDVDPGHLDLAPADADAWGSTLGRARLVLGKTVPMEYLTSDAAGLRQTIAGMLDFRDYDLVWISTARVAKRLAIPADVPTILDGDDFAYVRNWHLLRNCAWYGGKMLNYLDVAKLWWQERRLNREYDVVVRCSEEDRRRHAAANVVVIPNGTTIAPVRQRSPGCNLLFVGDLGYEPNRQGIVWFLERIWPRVFASLPQAQLHIAGRFPGPALQAAHGRDGIHVHGFVDDLGPLYDQAGCSVVPLLAGGGTRLKILESLSNEVPVVATTLGAYGLPLGPAEGVVRADRPGEFAHQCIVSLTDPATGLALARAGRELVRSRFDWHVVRQQVASLAREVSGAAGAPATG